MRTEIGEAKAKAARAAYNKEHLRMVGVNIRKEEAEAFREFAVKKGTTVGALLRGYIRGAMEESGSTYREESNPYAAVLTPKNMDRLKHEVAFHNPKHLNPDQMMNAILDSYFKFAEKVRG